MARSSASSFERLGRSPLPPPGPRVYLDYASFSPVDPRVVALMRPFLEGGVGNPNAPHSLGLEARASLDGSRAKVARLFAATPAGVIFTGSATEANHPAITGVTQPAGARAPPSSPAAAGAGGGFPLTAAPCHIDLLTLSSNDLYGPPGAGALWVRPTIKLAPQILGGGQEQGYRAGTENLPAIAGMGVAADLPRLELAGEPARVLGGGA